MLGVLPVAAQTTGIQRTWLSFQETSQLSDLLFGPGVAEVTTLSTGATTAGGTVSWVEYLERDDDLGMHHVYYRQQYHHPQLGRALRVVGTALSLHYAPDGSLRRANLAQVTDVPPLPQAVVSSSQQAFNAMQVALAGRPGYALGTPAAWPAGTMSLLLDNAELTLVPSRGGAGHRLQWRLTTLDAALFPWKVVVDASTGELLSLTPGAVASCWHRPACPSCDGLNPDDVVAKAEPESVELLAFCGPMSYSCDENGHRHVAANACSTCEYYMYLDEPQESCGGDPCTHEAVRAAYAGPEHPPTPQIEVYQGMNIDEHHLHCGYVGGQSSEGKYMRLGLKEQGGSPFYGIYGGGAENKGLSGAWVPHTRMRRQAGDAMFHTIKTMEQLKSLFGWCGMTGSCSDPVRIVVDALGGTLGGARFNPGPLHTLAPLDSVFVDKAVSNPAWPDRAQSAALDVIAHEWGHGVDKYGSAKFAGRCDNIPELAEICQMSEGFSDVIGHVVEHRVHVNEGVAAPASNFVEHPEQKDWAAGEDWDPTNLSEALRRADMYDGASSCPGQHYSVHADDEACEPGLPVTVAHSAGNRLSVVLKLLAEGGTNPACSLFGNCSLEVDGIGLDAAAEILFRVLVVEADTGTNDWDELPYLARGAVRDLFSVEECPAIQQSVFDAFEAVGYPEAVARPCVMCGPIQACPPCCPPPCCDEQQEE